MLTRATSKASYGRPPRAPVLPVPDCADQYQRIFAHTHEKRTYLPHQIENTRIPDGQNTQRTAQNLSSAAPARSRQAGVQQDRQHVFCFDSVRRAQIEPARKHAALDLCHASEFNTAYLVYGMFMRR